jgi:hypothetical protein
VALICEYHEELEIDLHCQNVDLLDLWRGKLSLRRLELMIRHLPLSSVLVRTVDPDLAATAEWTADTYMLADLFDLHARTSFKNPKPYPRPADALRKKRQADARHAALERQARRVNGR